MRLFPYLCAGVAGAVLFSVTGFGAVPNDWKLQVTQEKEDFALTVPVSRLTLRIPKEGLLEERASQGGATDNPRYFQFRDAKKGIIISGWFEAEKRFTSAKKEWEKDTKEWNRRGLAAPKEVAFEKIDGWDAVLYDMPIPSASNSHVRAHWVQAGTWIDIHLSVTSERSRSEC